MERGEDIRRKNVLFLYQIVSCRNHESLGHLEVVFPRDDSQSKAELSDREKLTPDSKG